MADVSGKSTARLIASGIDDAQALFRAEIELAKAGIIEELKTRLIGIGLVVGAAALILPGLALLLVALSLWLPGSNALNLTVVALAILALVGAGAVFGVRLIKRGPKNEALERVKEDVTWARDRLKR